LISNKQRVGFHKESLSRFFSVLSSGLEDAYWPVVPKFVGSNQAEAVGIFGAKKSPAHFPSEGK
jgi:hypothetical protein